MGTEENNLSHLPESKKNSKLEITSIPTPVIDKAKELLAKISDPMTLGETMCVDNHGVDCFPRSSSDKPKGQEAKWFLEMHTLGCRNAADTAEENWLTEHLEIYNEYARDSVVIGDPYEGVFVSIDRTRV